MGHNTYPTAPLGEEIAIHLGVENGQKSFRQHAFLMSLCEVGLPEAHNLTKCGKSFVEMGKNTFLTSKGPSTPSANQKTIPSSKLGTDY